MLRAVLTTHKEKDKMNPEQQQAILTIALLAAFADGTNDDREREEIRRLAESLGSEPGAPNLAGLYREVLLKRVDLTATAAVLTDPGHRQLAYEMAVHQKDLDAAFLQNILAPLPKSLRDMQYGNAITSSQAQDSIEWTVD